MPKLFHLAKPVLSLLLAATMAAGTLSPALAEVSDSSKQLDIAVFSDPHVYTLPATDRGLYDLSLPILDAAIEDVVNSEPDVLLIPGDLTRDGEKDSHEYLAAALADLQEALPDLKIYVTNGNHDINNSSGRNAEGEVDTVTPEEFAEIYKDFGYDTERNERYAPPENKKAGMLSYVARPAEGLTVIVADACKYTSDATESGLDSQITGGHMTEDLLQWISEKAEEAEARGDSVVMMEHHAVAPHYNAQTSFGADFILDNYEDVGPRLADAGIRYVFTGHGHAQDISSVESEAGNTLYDIETNSLVNFPSPVRHIAFTREVTAGVVTEDVEIETSYIQQITVDGETIDNFQQYAYETVVADHSMVNELVGGVVGGEQFDSILSMLLDNTYTTPAGAEHTGTRALIESLIGDDVADFLIGYLGSGLPTSFETGIEITAGGMNGRIYFDESNNSIVITIPNVIVLGRDQGEGTLRMTEEILKTKVIDKIFNELDGEFLSNPEYMSELLGRVINSLAETDVDDTHDFMDLAMYAYMDNCAGNPGESEAWAIEALEELQGYGTLVSELMDTAVASLASELNQILTQIDYDRQTEFLTLFEREGPAAGLMAVFVAGSLPNSIGGMFEYAGVDFESLVVDNVGPMLPGDVVMMAADLLSEVLADFMYDNDEADNNEISLTWSSDGSAVNPSGLPLQLIADASELKEGETFTLAASFKDVVETNAATVEFTYDADKFELVKEGTEIAENATRVKYQENPGSVSYTLMIQSYEAKDLVSLELRALSDVALEDEKLTVEVQAAVRTEDGSKTIAKAGKSLEGSDIDPGDGIYDGEVTLLILSNIIDFFGVGIDSPEWSSAAQYDQDHNGIIDIADIVYFAQKI